jgi:cysteine desulfurase
MNLFPKKRIYLDHAATTPVLYEVKKEMEKYWSDNFYNPSALYEEGVKMKEKLEEYRIRVARLLSAGKKDIIFTSGGTESDNLAILGVFEVYKESSKSRKKPHLIISSIEHPAVVESAREVERRGGEVSVVGVDSNGIVSPEEVVKLIRPETFLVSVMLANNEIGTVEPISKLGRLIREEKKKRQQTEVEANYPYFHTDASQAANYLQINIESLNVDLLTLDSSKFYGPKGTGVLVVRPGISIRPIIWGGGQERGLRSGTENLALISGFTKALEIVVRDREKESVRLKFLKDHFIKKVIKNISGAVINGSPEHSLPNIVSVSVPGVLSEMLLLALDQAGVIASVGRACSGSDREDGSPVLRAIGKAEFDQSTLRFSFGRSTSPSDINQALKIFYQAVSRVKIKK